MLSRNYFVRQAVTAFRLAKSTKDPAKAAALLDKAAHLNSQIDEVALTDLTPLAPDIEPPAG